MIILLLMTKIIVYKYLIYLNGEQRNRKVIISKHSYRPWHEAQAIACACTATCANQEKGGLGRP